MTYLKPLEGADRFLRLGETLGVIDVREGGAARPCVLVFVAQDTDDDDLAAVKVLARIQWPDREILVSRRAAVRQTGTQLRIPVMPAESSDASTDGDPPSPTPPRAKTG